MSLAIVLKEKNLRLGNQAMACVAEVTFDGSYPTGGEAITAAQLGVHTLNYLDAEGTPTYTFDYDRENGKLMAFVRATGAEAASEADLSAVVTRVFAIGS